MIENAVNVQRDNEDGWFDYMFLSDIYDEYYEEGLILGFVKGMREYDIPDSRIAQVIIEKYKLTPEQANRYLAEETTNSDNE